MTSTGTNYSKANPSSAQAASQGRMPQQTKPIAVISDFDDTIAIENVAELLFEELCADPRWRELRQQSRDKVISLREYQEQAFRMTGASRDEIQAKVKEKATLRPHFKELWDYTQQAGIPLAIVSLGMDFYIEALLAREGLDSIPRHSASADFYQRDHLIPLSVSLGRLRGFNPGGVQPVGHLQVQHPEQLYPERVCDQLHR